MWNKNWSGCLKRVSVTPWLMWDSLLWTSWRRWCFRRLSRRVLWRTYWCRIWVRMMMWMF